MSLLELKAYLQKSRVVNLAEIASHFNSEPEVVRQMLGHWIRKGQLRKEAKQDRCGSQCQKCSPLMTEIYAWVN